MIFDWIIIAIENVLRIILSVLPDIGSLPALWGTAWTFLANSFAGLIYLFPDESQFHLLTVLQFILWTEIAIFGLMLYEKVIKFFRG